LSRFIKARGKVALHASIFKGGTPFRQHSHRATVSLDDLTAVPSIRSPGLSGNWNDTIVTIGIRHVDQPRASCAQGLVMAYTSQWHLSAGVDDVTLRWLPAKNEPH